MVAVELQLRSDFLFLLHRKSDGVQYKIDCLCGPRLVGNDTVVKQIPNDRQVKHALTGADIGDVRDPLMIGAISLKFSVQQVFILVKLLPHLSPFPAAADFRQKFIFLHNTQDGFWISVYFLCSFQPFPHTAIAVCPVTLLLLLTDDTGKFCVMCRLSQTFDIVVVTAA